MNILDCFPWFEKGLVGLRGEVHGDVEEVHLNPVGLSSWDLQAVLLHDPVDLLQGQLRLPVGEHAGGESVVAVKADVEARGLELRQEEQSHNIAALRPIIRPHTHIKIWVLLFDPG